MPITRAMTVEYYSKGEQLEGMVNIGTLEQRKSKVVLDVDGFRFKSEEADDLSSLFQTIAQWASVKTTVGGNIYPRVFFKEQGVPLSLHSLIGVDFLSKRKVQVTAYNDTNIQEMSVEELYKMYKDRNLALT